MPVSSQGSCANIGSRLDIDDVSVWRKICGCLETNAEERSAKRPPVKPQTNVDDVETTVEIWHSSLFHVYLVQEGHRLLFAPHEWNVFICCYFFVARMPVFISVIY